MPLPYCYEYPRPAVTVDLAAFARGPDGIRVLLIRRKHDPFAGQWALPGGFVEIDERIEDAARRELKEETGVEIATAVHFLGFFDEPDRDPRGRTISMAYLAILPGRPPYAAGGDDAAEAAWLDPFEVSDLAFDHDEILTRARNQLTMRIMFSAFELNLLPDEFGLDELRRLFAEVRLDVETATLEVEKWARRGKVEPVPDRPGWYRKKT